MDKKARNNIIKKARTVDVTKTTMTHPFGIAAFVFAIVMIAYW